MALTRRRGPDRKWHAANPKPQRHADYEDRLVWHRAHAKYCACSVPPWAIYQKLKERGWWPEDLS